MKRIPGNKIRILLAAIAALVLLGTTAAYAEDPAGDDSVKELTIVLGDGVYDDGQGIWHMQLDEKKSLRFEVATGAKADKYTAELKLPDGTVQKKTSKKRTLQFSEKGMTAGTCTLKVTAWSGSKVTGKGTLTLVLEGESGGKEAVPDDPEMTDNPDDPSDGGEGERKGGWKKPSGGFGKGGAGGRTAVNAVTPGKALTTTHAKGSGVLAPYGTVELSIGSAPMEILEIGGEVLDLTCGGELFRGKIEDDALVLTREETEESAAEAGWAVSQKALKTLSESGIGEVRMIDAGQEVSLETDLEFSGSAYARERAEGYVSADFMICRREGNWSVCVEDREYDLSELAPDRQNGEER